MNLTLFESYYQPSAADRWSGRTDGASSEHLRWHQAVAYLDLRHLTPYQGKKTPIAILSFASDEGVRRNKGRVGAVDGPLVIIQALGSFSYLKNAPYQLFDAGTVSCFNGELEEAQQTLADCIELLLKKGYFPFLLGGGHEIGFGHYCGISQYLKAHLPQHQLNGIGMVNFDAHFDLRKPENDISNSGTPFWQAFEKAKSEPFSLFYQVFGIQPFSNTQVLFDYAHQNGVTYTTAEKFHAENRVAIEDQLEQFLEKVDYFMLTIDLDVFAASAAPGVSAPAFRGISPDYFFLHIYQKLLQSPKLLSVDVAEMNPNYDIDHRTARLAASFVYEAAQHKIPTQKV